MPARVFNNVVTNWSDMLPEYTRNLLGFGFGGHIQTSASQIKCQSMPGGDLMRNLMGGLKKANLSRGEVNIRPAS